MKEIEMPTGKNNWGNIQQRYEVISNPAVEVTENSDFNLPTYFPLFRRMEKKSSIDYSDLQLIYINLYWV